MSDPLYGSLIFHPDGSFLYTSDEDFIGIDKFTYFIFDGSENSNTAEVSIYVDPIYKYENRNYLPIVSNK